jgi:hypothetical protein
MRENKSIVPLFFSIFYDIGQNMGLFNFPGAFNYLVDMRSEYDVEMLKLIIVAFLLSYRLLAALSLALNMK